MKIGSNNTLTYLEPYGEWFKIFKFVNRKQSRPFDKQYTYGGARYFDIKLIVTNKNRITVRNGSFIYKVFSIFEVLDFFNKMGDTTVHISLDITAKEWLKDCNHSKELKFKEYCKMLETIYENINFCGGEKTFDGEVLYHFNNENPSVFVAEKESMWYKIVSMVSPRITRWLNNIYKEKYKNLHGIILLNHV